MSKYNKQAVDKKAKTIDEIENKLVTLMNLTCVTDKEKWLFLQDELEKDEFSN
ncbi:hypothetical protein A3Q56_08745 [Intoshia linei]|uniref:Uncharacterized protein n=1 Tax=Intoshia linei TaxID=1819745 RepID=A0A177AQK4_9BILA|nr:hypothetical protein A3Q56_08745 [Intoshia linei]